MPALFAYLIALCLLLGGGYGALNWLAAPEPVKIVAKARPNAKQPSYEARAEIPKAGFPAGAVEGSASAPTPSSAGDDTVLSSPIVRPALPEAETAAATVDVDEQPKTVKPAPEQQTRSASGEVLDNKAKRTGEKAERVSATPGNVLRKLERPQPKQASRRFEKRKLALMTLRTIQFPDGRRVTQLIPYRGTERVLAFELNE